jgi:hypothetical protein
MPQVPSTRWTVLDVLSASRELAKTVDQQKVIQEQGKYFYKAALSEMVTLLNSGLDPSYYTSTPLTVAADYEELSQSVISAISATAITRGTGVFVAGSNLIITLVLKADGSIVSQWIAKVTTGGAVAVIATVTGTPSTFNAATQNCSVIVEKSNATSPLSVDISAITFDRIIAIEDSTYGTCTEVSLKEFGSILRADFAHKSYQDNIIYCIIGNTIRFRNGVKCVSPGTKTMYYQRQPSYPVNFDDNDFVDLPDKHIPLLLKRIYTFLILQTENDVPHNLAQEMQLDYAAISNMAQAEIQNRFKSPLSVNSGSAPQGRG